MDLTVRAAAVVRLDPGMLAPVGQAAQAAFGFWSITDGD